MLHSNVTYSKTKYSELHGHFKGFSGVIFFFLEFLNFISGVILFISDPFHLSLIPMQNVNSPFSSFCKDQWENLWLTCVGLSHGPQQRPLLPLYESQVLM